MNQAAPAKFTFDLDMAGSASRANTFSEAKLNSLLDAARKEGFAQGQKAGAAEAAVVAQQGLQAGAEQLALQATQLLGAMDRVHKDALTQSATLGRTIGKKLANALIERMPTAPLDQLINDCLSSLGSAPHLAIRCHPDLAEAVTEIAQNHISSNGYSGRLIVVGEPEIALGDGKLEWVDGGLVRDIQAISTQVETIIADYLKAEGADPMQEEPEPTDAPEADPDQAEFDLITPENNLAAPENSEPQQSAPTEPENPPVGPDAEETAS